MSNRRFNLSYLIRKLLGLPTESTKCCNSLTTMGGNFTIPRDETPEEVSATSSSDIVSSKRVDLIQSETEARKQGCKDQSQPMQCVDDARITSISEIREITSLITVANRWDHLLARLGVDRLGHRVEPGLYALGQPEPASPVFVTANYTLSFDALRSALKKIDGYILVLDTRGVNVWCAAGKGTFGTEELVHKIEAVRLPHVVAHRELILPQLGAPGVAAHEVRKCSGFKVEYGPVRASDLPEYLKTRQATPEMRRIRFTLLDRLVLIPVELVHYLVPALILAIAMFLIGGFRGFLGVTTTVLAGIVLFPILLPWIPTPNFSTKGFFLGGLAALPFVFDVFVNHQHQPLWYRAVSSLIYLLAMPAGTAYLALSFTGSTTFTSKSGVRRETFAYIPIMAGMLGGAIVLIISLTIIRALGGTG